MENFF